ncbi:hypothetical protein V1478_004904 [Vespula squamosa]|uniref:Uncharacterized protein n=1 Tax=Vespula squamosa TaxID=30214 RepID=A0ABD2BF46_VESSQ
MILFSLEKKDQRAFVRLISLFCDGDDDENVENEDDENDNEDDDIHGPPFEYHCSMETTRRWWVCFHREGIGEGVKKEMGE